MPAQNISLEKAKQDKLFYFVANVIPYRPSDGRCLILKRHEREVVHAGKWAAPGGKLEWKDLNLEHPTRMNGDVFDFEGAVEDLLKRETKEEAGIEIESKLTYINSVAFVRPDGIPVVMLKFAARFVSGEVVLEADSFTEYTWVNSDEVTQYDCISGIQEEISQTIKLFSTQK